MALEALLNTLPYQVPFMGFFIATSGAPVKYALLHEEHLLILYCYITNISALCTVTLGTVNLGEFVTTFVTLIISSPKQTHSN